MDDLTSDSPTLPSALSGVGSALASRYEVRKRLGRGATKEVYLAYDRRLDREVALAIVVGASTALARARVAREAQVTGRLGDHPNVITVYDSGEIDDVPYLVLRVMTGGSLAEMLARERPSFDQAIRLGGEIASALAHAHSHDVIHRDVKPDNVWLTAGGSAALGDFGIAHQIGQDRLTAEGVVVGTVRYLAPEQIRGRVVAASDLYALGVTLYELVTGRVPFIAADATHVLAQHLTAPPVRPSRHVPALPPALERMILDLLAKDPEQRPASAADVAASLAAMAAGGSVARSLGDVPPRPLRSSDDASTAAPSPSPSSGEARRPDARRLVSVLAARADLEDPEALHGVFERCSAVIEQHGGTVERYLGDALVGFFGLSESHGDEALRAARAAVQLRAATAGLRIGIESGEVFLGAGPRGATIATGAAITAAGHLAERAAEGEILLGDRIQSTVGTATRIDVASGRLLELEAERPAVLRAPETPFVGRAAELGALRAAYEQARDDDVCRLVTVVGAPGIGKSRLAGELVAALSDEATVLAGRCLAYGEGTTYRAVAEIVRGLGEDPRARVRDLLAGDEQAIRGILGAAGLSNEPAQADETAWALRRLLERLARDRPLVVAVEDIHWAEPVLLDLLDHIVALSSDAPILLVCMTRPELLESRPAWAAPQPNRSMLVLDALGDDQALELARRLGAGDVAERVARRAEGNPLFVEQLVAVDAGQDSGELPVSIQAVLAARIDRLEPAERMLLQRAAVEGRTFHPGALAAVSPDDERPAVDVQLVALARKGLIGPDRPEFAGGDAFRFTHALIREAAYAGLPKVRRAEMHAGVAEWLEQRPAAADEIVGYHLEQACLLARELGRDGEREHASAQRAVGHLAAAARAAQARTDPAGASRLLERAVTLVAADERARTALLPALGAALFAAGRLSDATRILDDAIADAGEPRLQARARVEREFVRMEAETSATTELSVRVADAVLPVLEDEADDEGQSRVWSLRAQIDWTTGRLSHADTAWSRAAEYAARAGDERELFEITAWRAMSAVLGPTVVDEAIARCEAFSDRVAASPVAVAWTVRGLAVLRAMRGDFEQANRLIEQADETLRELGSLQASVSHQEAQVQMLAGRPALAEQRLRETVERIESMNAVRFMATTLAMLAQTVYAQGRPHEAAEFCEASAAGAAQDDILTQVIWRGVHAKVLAGDGRGREAVALAREAVALIEPTDLLSHHGDAMLELADVLRICHAQPDKAFDAAQAGLELYIAKGNLASERRARALLAEMSREA